MSFEEKTVKYAEWLVSRGIKISPKIEIHDFREQNQGRGMIAIEGISKDDVLITIPQSSTIKSEDHEKINNLVSKYKLDEWSALILLLMAESNNPIFKPYFDVLPTEFNTPIFWDTETTAKLLKGSTLPSKIGRHEADLMYDELAAGVLTEKPLCDLPEKFIQREYFHKIGSLIMSYAFDLPVDSELSEDEDLESEFFVKAMIPPADVLNAHTTLNNVKLVFPDNGDGDLEIIAIKDINAGEQIYNTYGELPSCDLLRKYGYVEWGGTPYEVAEIDTECVTSQVREVLALTHDDMSNRLRKFEEIMELPESFEFCLDEEELVFDEDLIMFVNFMVDPSLSEKKLVKLMENEQLLDRATEILNLAIEMRTREYVPKPVQPKKPEQLGGADVLVDRESMCEQVRVCELKVLQLALDWVDPGNKKTKVEK